MSVTLERIVRDTGLHEPRQLYPSNGDAGLSPELERDYRTFFLAERRGAICSVNIVLALLVAVVGIGSLWGEPLAAHVAHTVRVAVLELAWMSMLAAGCSRHFERFYLRTASVASILIAAVGAIEIGYRIQGGEAALFGLLTAYSLALYFLLGLLYRAAVLANAAMIVALCATLASLGSPVETTIGLALLLGATATIGGIAFRQQGRSLRRSFLDRRLIADMAVRDGLTRLRNRRAFDEHLERAWRQAVRERCTLGVLMIDVDHFKQFNDLYGHLAGDEALKAIAEVTDGVIKRPFDLAARFGGEEFAVILFDSTCEYAVALAESLRVAVEALGITHAGNEPGRVTVSVGVAVARPAAQHLAQSVVALADEAMYSAKHDGRNRVRLCDAQAHDCSIAVASS